MLREFKTTGLKHIGPPPPEERDPATRLGLDHDPRHIRRAIKRRTARLMREQNAIDHIGGLPGDGEDIILIMSGSFHGWDILTAVLQMAGEGVTVEDLHLATLGFNNAQADHLAAMLDAGTVARCTFIVSQMFAAKNAREFDHLKDVLESRGHRIAATRNHAKLMLLKLSDGRRIAAHGSLNLRRCNSYEQIQISNDPGLHEFFKQFIDDILNESIQP